MSVKTKYVFYIVGTLMVHNYSNFPNVFPHVPFDGINPDPIRQHGSMDPIILTSLAVMSHAPELHGHPSGKAGTVFEVQCHLSSVQNPGWLSYIEDYTTQLYRDYNKPF